MVGAFNHPIRSTIPEGNQQMSSNSKFLFSLIAVSLIAGSSADAQSTAKPATAKDTLPNVLILGDSISMGYTPVVTQRLKGKANVFRPTNEKGRAENCAGTVNGVKNIDRWLKAGDRKWSVIHFNFGLHDLKRVQPDSKKNSNDPKHPRQSEPDAYRKQLTEIVAKLKKTKATLIFATTTPIPAGGVKPHRDIADPERYNAIAREIMKANNIEINDLFALANPRQKEIMRPVNVHFTKQGSEVLGKQVAETIENVLNRNQEKKD